MFNERYRPWMLLVDVALTVAVVLLAVLIFCAFVEHI